MKKTIYKCTHKYEKGESDLVSNIFYGETPYMPSQLTVQDHM